MRVVVGIVTYGRPDSLGHCLGSLADLAPPEGAEVKVVVVDNDADRSAEGVVREAGERLRWPVRYVVEPEKGIPFARNRLVREALDADLLAFIDDDEEAHPSWLWGLVDAWQRSGADVVQGVVHPRFDDGAPSWAERGGFFEKTGPRWGRSRLKEASSCNALVSTEVFETEPTWFDPAFRRSGGSDSEFFRRILGKGRSGVWAPGAVAGERIGADRANVGWVVRRAYRTGTVSAYMEFRRNPSVRAAIHQLRMIVVGLLKGVRKALLSRGGWTVWLVHILVAGARGAGRLAGMLGHLYPEYDSET